MNREVLLALADRCEAATGPDRELDCLIYAEQLGGGEWRDNVLHVPSLKLRLGSIDPGEHSRNFVCWFEETPRYTASLDAAMTLTPEGWGGNVNWPIGRNHGPYEANFGSPDMEPAFVTGHGALPALALCAAALRARASTDKASTTLLEGGG